MSHDDAPFEIHVHGDVKLRDDVGFDALQDALKPLWKYAGARSLADGAASLYEDEPGIRFDPHQHLLQMCWTLQGEDDFRLGGPEVFVWSGKRGSNSRPQPWQGCALPTELFPRCKPCSIYRNQQV